MVEITRRSALVSALRNLVAVLFTQAMAFAPQAGQQAPRGGSARLNRLVILSWQTI